jgi:hypothetical protein
MALGLISVLPSGSSTGHEDADLLKLNWASELASNKKKHFPSLSSVTLREYEWAHRGNRKGRYNIGPLSIPKPLPEVFDENCIKLQVCVRERSERRERKYLSSENYILGSLFDIY